MKSVICNWKMNPQSLLEAKTLFDATKNIVSKTKNVEVIVAPPTVFLSDITKSYRGSQIEFAAQNIFYQAEGSYTGETSAMQVRDRGATHAIIGHAERRALGVTDEDVHHKVIAGLQGKLDTIVAIGESERDQHGEYIHEVRRQIKIALDGVPEARFKNIVIAYEPVWAIGAPDAPDAHAVHQMMLLVRKTIADTYGDKAMRAIRVIYGGAVNENNADDILNVPDLDGVLVGRASLDPSRLDTIIRAAENAS